jgi:hypothetical protein
MGRGSLFHAVTDREKNVTNSFQQWNTRIAEIVRNMCCIYTDLETQQKLSDKIRLIIHYIYVHLQVSIAFATIVILFYKNIDEM